MTTPETERNKITDRVWKLGTDLYNESSRLRAARTAAETVAAEAARVREAWLESTRRPDGSRGGQVPTKVNDFEAAARMAEKLATDQTRIVNGIVRTITGLKKVRDAEHATMCPDCGLRAVTLHREAYNDVDRCANCNYYLIVHALGD